MANLLPDWTSIKDALCRWYKVQPGDILYRHCVFPHSFSKAPNFDKKRYWNLTGKHGEDLIETSVAWERFAPTLGYVHAYGCRLAAYQTKQLRESGELQAPPRIYCGAYQFSVDAVRLLKGAKNLKDIVSAEVVHRIEENGELAHAALLVKLKDASRDIENLKTAIVAVLWKRTNGPFKHICSCDRDLKNNHPNLRMEDAPNESPPNPRSLGVQLWRWMRFQVDRVIWHVALTAEKKASSRITAGQSE